MLRHRRWAVLAVTTLALSVTLAACGGSGSSSDKGSRSTSRVSDPAPSSGSATTTTEKRSRPQPTRRQGSSASQQSYESSGSSGSAPAAAQTCTSFADSTYIPSMTTTVLQRSDGLRVTIWHARSVAHAVQLQSSDGRYDGRTAYRAPQSFYGGDLQVLGVNSQGYKIQLDPKESQVVTGQVTRAILHVCRERWKQVGGRTDIW